MAMLLATQTLAQLPPGGSVIRIDAGAYESDPSINDAGTIAFSTFEAGTADILTFDRTNGITQITDHPLLDLLPTINSNGVIAWQRGEFDGNYEIAIYDQDGLAFITDTPDPEGRVAINDLGQLTWYMNPCSPSADCRDTFLYDPESATIERLTFGGPGRASADPKINNLGQVAWTEFD